MTVMDVPYFDLCTAYSIGSRIRYKDEILVLTPVGWRREPEYVRRAKDAFAPTSLPVKEVP